MDAGALAENPRAADPNIPALAEQWQQYIGERIKTETVAEWLEIFEAAGIPCSPFRLPEETWDEPHARATGMVVDIEHPIGGTPDRRRPDPRDVRYTRRRPRPLAHHRASTLARSSRSSGSRKAR